MGEGQGLTKFGVRGAERAGRGRKEAGSGKEGGEDCEEAKTI